MPHDFQFVGFVFRRVAAGITGLYLVLFSGAALSQDVTGTPASVDKYFIRSWGVNSGLPQLSVNVIVQSRNGYLWLGTQAGLSRFDGVRFVNFGLKEGLRGMFVKCLLEDRSGALWIGTTGGGLSRMREGLITTFTDRDGITSDSITSLAEDGGGGVWVGTIDGLFRWDGSRFHRVEPGNPRFKGIVMALCPNSRGSIWVAMRNNLLLEGGAQGFVEVDPPDPKWPCQAMLEDRSGRLWTSHGNGLMNCRENGRWIRFDTGSGVPFERVISITEDAGGKIWIGSTGEGIFCLENGRFVSIQQEVKVVDQNIVSLLFDHEQNLWVGTRAAGLYRLRPKCIAVYGVESGLSSDYIQSVAESGDGRLWVATSGTGLFVRSNGVFERFLGVTPEEAADLGGYTFVKSVLTTAAGDTWFSGASFVVQTRSNRVLQLLNQNDKPWLKSDDVVSMTEDRLGGIWFSTRNSGLQYYRDGQWSSLTNGMVLGHLTSVVCDRDDAIWVGSMNMGIRRVGSNGVFSLDKRQGLTSDCILALHLDADRALWIGASGGGLSRWLDGRLDTFTQRHGLPDVVVSQILEDGAFLWLGSNRGIVRVSKQELDEIAAGRRSLLNPLILGRAEGMLIEECSSGSQTAAVRTRSGLLCFSTIKGLAVVDPDQLVLNTNPPNVLIEEIVVDGAVFPSDARAAGASALAGTLRVPPGAVQVEVFFTALSYSSPEKVRFRYKLEDLDSNWVEAGSQRHANYSHLAPGSYRFHVIAANNNGVWNEQGAALSIVVQPYFWQTRWFLASGLGLFASVVAAAAWLVSRRRSLARIDALERINTLERERSRIARDIHDDLGARVTKISMIAQSAEAESPRGSALREYVREIHSTSQELIQAMDETVWAVNPKNDTLIHLAHYIFHFVEEFFRHTPIRRHLVMSDDLPALPLTADKRHNLFMATKEALHNVVKHAAATEVRVEITFQHDVFRVVVVDNGRGMVNGRNLEYGDGLANMKSRMEQCGGVCSIQGAPGQGTTITLTLQLTHK